MMDRKIITLCLLFWVVAGNAQISKTRINGYGHIDFTYEQENGASDAFMNIGEHDLFITSTFTKNISFLSEMVVKPSSGSSLGFVPGIERARIKFRYFKNHSIIVGRMHTPVSYWNDVYHHGRVFFPTIDRPLAFSYFTPIHVVGLRLQGQNLGKLNFGYDVVIGNTTMTGLIFDNSTAPSVTVAAHIKPKDQMRIGFGLFHENYEHEELSGHSHSHGSNMPSEKTGFSLINFSFANFGEKVHVLNEFSMNITNTDSLGLAENFSNYIYLGIPIKERFIPFIGFDFLSVDDSDLLNMGQFRSKYILGYRHEFTPLINIKTQVEYYDNNISHMAREESKLEFKIQVAYGF